MSNFLLPDELVAKAREVVDANRRAGRRVAVAESCTGGLVSAAITEIAGSSEMFEAGYVTYSNAAKMAGCNANSANSSSVRRRHSSKRPSSPRYSVLGLSNIAASAGLSVSALKADSTTDTAIVNANCW